jgi:hypothetical protein
MPTRLRNNVRKKIGEGGEDHFAHEVDRFDAWRNQARSV